MASRIAAAEPAIARSVSPGFSQDGGTKEGPARWYSSLGRTRSIAARRPERFVTRRITRAAAAIALGLQDELTLGALGAVRDWSFAGDIVRGAWLMLQQPHADDYVLASGVPHTVAELAHAAFACVELEAERYVRVDPDLVRPEERTAMVGDPGKARERLGWEPTVDFEALVERMVRADLHSLEAVAGRS